MNQDEAREALAILRNVVNRARDDSALQNWGIIWIVHGVTNGLGFIGSGLMLNQGIDAIPPHAALWGAILVFDFAYIAVARRGKRGVQTFVERQIWSIWVAFLFGVLLTAGVNYLRGMQIFALMPIVAVLAAFALAMMGSLIHKVYFVAAVVFALLSQIMAALPGYAMYLFGAVWFLFQTSMGSYLHRQKRAISGGGVV